MRMIRQGAVVVAAALLGACSLDLQNPNSPTETQVTTSVDGVIALATGLQGRFAASYGSFIYTAGLVTDEFASTSSALISISDAEQGAVPSGTAIADAVFSTVYRTVRTADDLLTGSVALAAQIDPEHAAACAPLPTRSRPRRWARRSRHTRGSPSTRWA